MKKNHKHTVVIGVDVGRNMGITFYDSFYDKKSFYSFSIGSEDKHGVLPSINFIKSLVQAINDKYKDLKPFIHLLIEDARSLPVTGNKSKAAKLPLTKISRRVGQVDLAVTLLEEEFKAYANNLKPIFKTPIKGATKKSTLEVKGFFNCNIVGSLNEHVRDSIFLCRYGILLNAESPKINLIQSFKKKDLDTFIHNYLFNI